MWAKGRIQGFNEDRCWDGKGSGNSWQSHSRSSRWVDFVWLLRPLEPVDDHRKMLQAMVLAKLASGSVCARCYSVIHGGEKILGSGALQVEMGRGVGIGSVVGVFDQRH